MSLNSDTLTWFRVFAFTLNAVCVISEEATYTNFIVFDLTRPRLFIKWKWKIVPVKLSKVYGVQTLRHSKFQIDYNNEIYKRGPGMEIQIYIAWTIIVIRIFKLV